MSNELPYAPSQERGGRVRRRRRSTSVTAAAASAKFAEDTDFRVSITNAPGEDAYPISSFTWLLVRKNADDGKAKASADFLQDDFVAAWMARPARARQRMAWPDLRATRRCRSPVRRSWCGSRHRQRQCVRRALVTDPLHDRDEPCAGAG